MIKRFGVMLIAFLVIVLSACGNEETATTGAGGAGEAKESPETVKIATDAAYAPMEFMDKGEITGFDIDFLKEVMAEAGIEYELSNTGWDAMLTSVQQGTEFAAGISSVSITEERKATYDYSLPYFESTNMILFKEGAGITSAMDLKDMKVAVQGATTADTLMTEIMGQGNSSLKKFESNVLAFMELESGGVDAAVADVAIVQEYMKNNPDKAFESILDPENFDSEYYGILYPKGSELKAKLDPAIKAVIDNGKYAEVYKKWFGNEPDLTRLKEELDKAAE
ncbi:basic amino acid ABC transporter substrate-binding protein [Paenibacillus shunpengii]|uniref:Basic amino acid ABC transporter substrate-binding protein n=1 Tax=Paenibacillus shunpengii TaxID=2054424 RepID=A0ABW5SPE3_9BACL|nr:MULTISPECIES: basic amino acid ABC transporter substrate-binding protein [unclassified Paenibacillus]OMC65620.1 basic amino acid ABC transporter substrate-binding protein [Paenibacillus sp. FSL H7-0326]SDX24100.1 amino acid ABC transporter substrate-binding protein, PAAT family [Paenibacillus sp. PDC88]